MWHSHGPLPSPRTRRSHKMSKKKHFTETTEVSTQTRQVSSDDCDQHNKRITELLREMAVTLNEKGVIEKELEEMKARIPQIESKHDLERKELEKKIIQLKNEKLDKELALSNLKVTTIEEHKILLSQINMLKSELQHMTAERDNQLRGIKENNVKLEQKLLLTESELTFEKNKSANLEFRVNKYRMKLKNWNNYIKNQNGVKQGKFFKNIEQSHEKERTNQSNCSKTAKDNVADLSIEDMVLGELFFKRTPINDPVASVFFRK